MALYSLPLILESVFSNYLRANYAGSYNIFQGFSTTNYQSPAIIVSVGKLSEETPFSHVYKGELIISIRTQIDDQGTNSVEVHDLNTAAVYDLVFNEVAVTGFLNTSGNRLHIYNYYNSLYDIGISEREYVTNFTFDWHGQTLELGAPADII